ncbi:MAG TPA: hypothetical protein PKB14_03065 [Rubrivivax sp.]|nr:hypothetical protein [Rubrivivax sp.]
MTESPRGSGRCGCGEGPRACAFAKALLAQQATCGLAHRRSIGEQSLVECASPAALGDCSTLAALLRERARFALRLPPETRPLLHMQALRLQCGGLEALHGVLDSAERDVHRLVGLAQQRHGSLADLPWAALVPPLAAWQPWRRRPATR